MMSSSSVASPKPRGAKKILTDVLAELKSIATYEEGEAAAEANALRKEIKKYYSDRSRRFILLMRAAEVMENYFDRLEEEYLASSHDEMFALDEELERITELIDDTEEWAEHYS